MGLVNGQRTRQYPAAREPAYRPPPRPLSRSSSRNIRDHLTRASQRGAGPLDPSRAKGRRLDPADPGSGHQMLTGVTREHRGHRLGLLVKVAMLEVLRAAEPQLERIDTWNAESNRYMIAVNEALGYTVLGPPASWWKLDVAALSGLAAPAAGLGEQALASRARY